MDLAVLLGLAAALAMDAFAVALGTGLTIARLTGRHLFRLSFHFGLFQALMPIIGWFAGRTVRPWIENFDHWIAFGLLLVIGGKMIHEAFAAADPEAPAADPTRGFSLVLLSIATSVDALAVGLSLAVLGVDIWIPALVIGLVAALFTFVGMLLGRRIGVAWGPRVEVLGGLVLIGIGIKILLDHLLAG